MPRSVSSDNDSKSVGLDLSESPTMMFSLTKHGVCFAWACDPVGENGGIEAFKDRRDHFLHTFFIDGLVALFGLIHAIEGEGTVTIWQWLRIVVRITHIELCVRENLPARCRSLRAEFHDILLLKALVLLTAGDGFG